MGGGGDVAGVIMPKIVMVEQRGFLIHRARTIWARKRIYSSVIILWIGVKAGTRRELHTIEMVAAVVIIVTLARSDTNIGSIRANSGPVVCVPPRTDWSAG